MKTGKIILVTAVVVAVSVGITTWFLVNNLDRFAREKVEDIGSDLLDTRVSLESVSVSPFEGRAVLQGLKVANPAGYSDATALTLGTIDVDINLGSLDKEIMVIEKILIRDPLVSYELDQQGKSNMDVLLGSIESAAGDSGDGAAGSDLLIIDRLDVKGGHITASAADKPGKTLTFDFPVVFMTGLGSPEGATQDEIGSLIAEDLMKQIIRAAARAGVQDLVDAQKEKLLEKATEKLDEKLKDILKKD